MGSELFKLQSLEDIASIHDSDRKPVTKSDRTEGEYPYYGASGITDYIDDYIFDGKYVLLSEDGDNLRTRNTPIAFIARGKFWVNNHAHILKGKNGNDTDFICYALQVADVKSYISGSTRPKITQRDMKKIPIYCPEIPEQKRIAHILGSLDDKIELNHQMNETLESMAQALFKSWFVDFDPVIDNALVAGNPIPDVFAERAALRIPSPPAPLPKSEGSRIKSPLPSGEGLGEGEHAYAQLDKNSDEKEKSHKSGGGCFDSAQQPSFHSPQNSHQSLFPSEFEFTEEMGWIPKGWKVLPIPDVTEFREGPGVLAKDFHDSGVPLIRLAGLKNGVSLLDGCNYLDPEKVEKKWSHFRLKEGDILLSSSASLGRVAEVQSEAIGAIPYTGIIGFRPIENKSVRRYIRHYLISSHFQMQVSAMGVGSVLNHFGPTHIKKMIMPVPSLLVQNEFSNIVTPFDSQIAQRLSESNTIAKLRDTLLPKLLSGELRIPDAEKLIKEASV